MKAIIIIIFAFMSVACSNISEKAPNKLKARITYYTAHEDKYGARVACSSKVRAKEGITVAAHPDFPFWTQIRIPGLKALIGKDSFVVQDRGRAVTRKKASGGQFYVFDVFLNKTNKAMRRFASKAPAYMEVIVPNKS